MYEAYNFLINFLKKNKNIKNLKENYIKILICFSPVIPHFANECLTEIGANSDIKWPNYDKNLLNKEDVNIVIQINGKKRALFNMRKGINETDLLETLKKDNIVKKYLEKKKIVKVIFVKDRLINILLDD